MQTQSFSHSPPSDPNETHFEFNLPQIYTYNLPILIAFSSTVSCKIQKHSLISSCTVVEIFSKKGNLFQIRPSCSRLLIRQIQTICWNSMPKINIMEANQTNMERAQFFQSDFIERSNSEEAYLFQIKVRVQNNRIRIQFDKGKFIMEQQSIDQSQLLSYLIYFIEQIKDSIMVSLQRMGTIKPSFSQRFKYNLRIQKQKQILQKFLSPQNKKLSPRSDQPMEEESLPTQNGIFQKIQILKELPLPENETVAKRGGYFNVFKKKFVIQKQENQVNSIQEKIIAEKRLGRRKRHNTPFNYQGKIPKELKFLENLSTLSKLQLNGFAKYYLVSKSLHLPSNIQNSFEEQDYKSRDSLSTMSQENYLKKRIEDVIYMEFYQENLEEYLTRKGKLDLFEIIDLLKQIFSSVMALHRAGIIHRDIKPSNFMVQAFSNGAVRTKIIDFGQSTLVTSQYSAKDILGFSTRYAPIECTYSCKQGYNFKQIDLWSIGVVIYQLTTKRMPVTYSKSFKSDINAGWPTDLGFFINQYNRGLYSIPQSILVMISTLFMKVDPKRRMNLSLGLDILERVESMLAEFSTF